MIVLHTTKYSENSLIIHGYTLEGGRVGTILRGAVPNGGKRRGSPIKGNSISILHPLSIISAQCTSGRKGGLEILKEYSPKYILPSIRSEITKSTIALFISELLYRTLLLPEGDESMYQFLENAILLLERSEGPIANFHIWFLIGYTTKLGFAPLGDFGSEFDPFSAKQREVLKKMTDISFIEAMKLPMEREQRGEMIESFLKYMEFHTGNRIRLNSLAVLKEIFKN